MALFFTQENPHALPAAILDPLPLARLRADTDRRAAHSEGKVVGGLIEPRCTLASATNEMNNRSINLVCLVCRVHVVYLVEQTARVAEPREVSARTLQGLSDF